MMGKTIVITSGKRGVGKTTATANLGAALALRDRRVVVIDTDIGLRNLDVVMGLENRIVYDLVDVVEGTCKLSQAMIRDKNAKDLHLIPAAQTRDKSAIQPEQLRELCEELKKEADYVLIDCPAGIEQGFRNAVAAADAALVVTTPEVSAIRDADWARPASMELLTWATRLAVFPMPRPVLISVYWRPIFGTPTGQSTFPKESS